MKAVLAVVILGAAAAAFATAVPTNPSTGQHRHQDQPNERRDIGVGDVNFGRESFNPNVNVNNKHYPSPGASSDSGVGRVNFGVGSFNPNVNVNNTAYPPVHVPIGTYHPLPCNKQRTPVCQ
ncbi:uncharacterized protein LOC124545488 [Schistocerca americana]|uniref:uncharacterized protein LOC124545488 n=1 Tax=Schistocerca americana TaxID=7009 RepID=UPI001F4FA2E1|nr:uncharacterized protein LOC124545488 [Schistocerca americana]